MPSSRWQVYHFCSRMHSKPANIIQLHQTAVGFVVLKNHHLRPLEMAVSLFNKSLSEQHMVIKWQESKPVIFLCRGFLADFLSLTSWFSTRRLRALDKDGLYPPIHLCMETYSPASSAVAFTSTPPPEPPTEWQRLTHGSLILKVLPAPKQMLSFHRWEHRKGKQWIVIPQLQQRHQHSILSYCYQITLSQL